MRLTPPGTIRVGLISIVVILAQLTPPLTALGASQGQCAEVALILDESGSVAPYESSVRSAVTSFLSPLTATGASVAIIEFGTSAKTVFGYTQVTSDSLADVFGPYVAGTSSGDVYDAPSQLGGFTNWDDALDEATQLNTAEGAAPLVLFITDGDPTAYNLDQTGEPGGVVTGGVSAEGLSRAVDEAVELEGQGSQVIAVGVGNAASSVASVARLQQVAGPNVFDGTATFDLAATDVILVPDFDDLAAALALVAQAYCAAPALTVVKTASSPFVIAGTEVTYQITVTNTGNVDLHDVEVSDPLVAACNATIGGLAVGESVTVTCTATVWAPTTNTATATGEDPFGTPVSDDDSTTVGLLASGTGTPGFWKNHQDLWPVLNRQVLVGDWDHSWVCDADEVCLSLTIDEALAALGTAPRGDMTWNLARPLVAAWLNITSGNDATCVAETVDLAVAWLLDHPIGSDVGGGDDDWNEASGWAALLDAYNNGLLCAESRDAAESGPEASPPATSVPPATGSGGGDDSEESHPPGKAVGRPDHAGGGKKP